ncbi:MAG TPA: acetylxylan esterase [Bryobacteraceae bacterium]|nr:acetylxylan esterase [Bryobacteraceae bacterium]
MRLLSGLFLLGFSLAAQAPPTAFDEWINRQAQRQLAARKDGIRKIRSRADAEAHQRDAKARILEVFGGLPAYRGPLNAKVTGTLDAGAYRIEKVMFESLPKYWITGNLYVPKSQGKHPAVLYAIGHWNEGKPAAQRMAANLASQGFVVLAFDPMGQGERFQGYWSRAGVSLVTPGVPQHWTAGTAAILINQTLSAYFVWDGVRALDYLTSRPEVDAERIGCTGCSGGGTQATYISALDPRVKVAAPLCYMQSFEVLFPGSIGDSEQSPPNFLARGLDQTDYVEIFAPKPWFIGSTKEDFFTPAGAKPLYEEARNFYEILGVQDRIRWVVGPGGHGTPLEIREGVYEWFNRWLNNGNTNWKERPVKMFTNEDLRVTATGQLGTDSRDLIEILREQRAARPVDGEMDAYVKRLAVVAPTTAQPVVENEEKRDGLSIRKVTIPTEPGVTVSGWIVKPVGSGQLPGVVHVERTAKLSPRAIAIAKAGAEVFAVMPRALPAPPRYMEHGDWEAATRSWLTGRNLPAMRAIDIATAVRALEAQGPVRGVADGVHAVALLLASRLEPKLARLWLERAPYSFAPVFTSPRHLGLHDAVMPGFYTKWDLADLAKERQVTWMQPTDWNNTIVRLEGPLYRYRAFDEMDEGMIRWLLQ